VTSAGRRQALGQHFLRDAGVAHAIVAAVAPTAADLVLEIGPGDGALTGLLAARAGRLVALEIDQALAGRLRQRHRGLEVIEGDARTWPYASLERPAGGRVLVVGNLPYSSAKPILAALVSARTAVDEMCLMLQLEVAERVAAAPGGRIYGSLSVLTQLYCDVRIVLRVPAASFRPPPKVESSVVHLRVLPRPRVAVVDERRFRSVVLAAFAQRRKMLANALAASLGVPATRVREVCAQAGIDADRRAETLEIGEFAALASRL
jgi:16S rRNA (adenine1518-N6/adenine1519-N6)-dimethyltransferase